jgi:uncharacterized protein YjiS (DUF1127 family)
MTMLNSTSNQFARSAARPSPTYRKARFFLKSVAHVINGWIAEVIAQRERQANLCILRKLGDRELRDIGLSRNQIGEGLSEAAKDRAEMQKRRCR